MCTKIAIPHALSVLLDGKWLWEANRSKEAYLTLFNHSADHSSVLHRQVLHTVILFENKFGTVAYAWHMYMYIPTQQITTSRSLHNAR